MQAGIGLQAASLDGLSPLYGYSAVGVKKWIDNY
jgi:hypothetical protein